ncbi:hypothetical protein B0I35DRAFT_102470 [Stachybotrys elegans]|uniref:Extracellular membrane protein CFEM domain-containing protein n=1 Tax=Stachybotrys elegans TaxID=80388 RepID=A0A8K0WL03_9HYPO|nr:hypothetical protein B0I35DRAFT_102470 [Stachybotrys elegans]
MARTSFAQMRLINLLFLAGIAASQRLSLSTFQAVGSDMVSLGCMFAYSTRFTECDQGSIIAGNGCSPACQADLQAVQSRIQDRCEAITPIPGSLLESAMNGGLVQALCSPGRKDELNRDNDPEFQGPSSSSQEPPAPTTPPVESLPINNFFLSRTNEITITTSIVPKAAAVTQPPSAPVGGSPNPGQPSGDGSGSPYDMGSQFGSGAGSLEPRMSNAAMVVAVAIMMALLY